MRWIQCDGGRQRAGYKGVTGDCVTRAIAIAANLPYQEVYDALNELASNERRGKRKKSISNARTGVHRFTYEKYLFSLGWKWQPTMTIGSGCKVHVRDGELPTDKWLILSLSKHLCAFKNNFIFDMFDPSRNGTRCVYGYYYLDSPSTVG